MVKAPIKPRGKIERSAEVRSRMSAAQKGRGKGIRKSLETRLKMEAAQSVRRAKEARDNLLSRYHK